MVEKSDVYVELGAAIYRASTLGGCLRSLVAARLGETATPPPARMQEAFTASAGLEDEALKMYAAETGHEVTWQQKEVELVVPLFGEEHANIVAVNVATIRGHIDGLDRESDAILEVKSLGDAYWHEFQYKGLEGLGALGLKYQWQGAVYGHSTGRNVIFVIAHKEKGEKGEWAITELVREPAVDPETLVRLEDVRGRVREVEYYASIDELPDCDRECKKGAWWDHVHLFPAAQQGGDELAELLSRHVELGQRIKELTAEKDDISEAIKEQYGEGKHAAGGFIANITPLGVRFNSQRFKRDYRELYEEYREPQLGSRLVVTGQGQSEQGEAG